MNRLTTHDLMERWKCGYNVAFVKMSRPLSVQRIKGNDFKMPAVKKATDNTPKSFEGISESVEDSDDLPF